MPLGTYPRMRAPAQPEQRRHAVETYPETTREDPLTRNPRSLQVFTTGQISDANSHNLAAPTPTQVVRLRTVWVLVTGNAAQSAAGVLTVQVDDNDNPTGITIPVFVPGAAGTTLGAVTVGPFDLGEGYVTKTAGAPLVVKVSAALTAGKIAVLATGSFETAE